MLLILTLKEIHEESRLRVLNIARDFDCFEGKESVFLLRTGEEHSPRLRELALACSAEGCFAWLSKRSLPSDGYRPIAEVTDQFASQIDSWRRAEGRLPPLQPGDLIRIS